mmetsp:Transcript_23676/g.40742  ORF Transcript_23676/g.40742 Transcript_23676/m.40742 type:complete len:255 (+) Transcript_23676:78-842(+)|eukprot:CAMPEP_0196656618 /NCGR_PEP_ID=MMETSP1086-20130531/18884_1 /TAXON_ID=77921 /ORGANISM="Cyanoptyche  gloeocystis , Strain SAG4.97" /LENGTH=254 /DNA_ID=CAMNT_0041989449 /DNA_START=75 /DNA_END=839 /DNA_ORIENTATION=+
MDAEQVVPDQRPAAESGISSSVTTESGLLEFKKALLYQEATPQPEKKPSALESGASASSVRDILNWKNPVLSGVIFGIGNFFFYLLLFRGYTVLSLLAYGLLAEVVICFAYVNFFNVVSNLLVKKPSGTDSTAPASRRQFHLSRDVVGCHIDAAIPYLNVVEDTVMNILLCTDNVLALKGMAALFCAAVLGNLFSFATLCYLAFLGAFGGPKLYEMHRLQIHRYMNLGLDYAKTYSNLLIDRIPKATDLKKKSF